MAQLPEYMTEVTEEEFRIFVGDNADKFEAVRQKILSGQKGFKFSWPAFLVLPVYAAYRKLWSITFFWLGILLLVEYFSRGNLSTAMTLPGAIVFASLFNNLYVHDACKKIAAIKKQALSPTHLTAALVIKGRTSKGNIALACLLLLFYGFLNVLIQLHFNPNFLSDKVKAKQAEMGAPKSTGPMSYTQ